MATVFLTGASGFLGGHLLRELRTAGHDVRALSRRPDADGAITAAGGEPIRVALDDVVGLTAALRGCDAVFHAAADTSQWRGHAVRQTATNVQGTANLLTAAKAVGVQAFVHTSSTAAWSHLVSGVLTEDVPQRGSESSIHYEVTKHQSEQLVRSSGLPWVVLNPAHILGPGDRQNWARLIMMVDQEALPGIPPGVGVFADVREVAKAHVRAFERKLFGAGFLLGGPQASFLELIHQVGEMLGRRTPRRALPRGLLLLVGQCSNLWSRVSQREPDVTAESARLTSHVLLVDSSKATRELGYVQTPLPALLADTLSWLKAEGLVGRRPRSRVPNDGC
jgi:dihydroflavonol-4-reductase